MPINIVPIVVAALAAFAIGFLWHGPLFGSVWIRLMELTPADIEKGKKEMGKKMPLTMLVAFVQQLVMAFVVANFAAAWGVSDVYGAFQLTFWLWLGLIATVLLNGVLWENKKVNLYLFGVIYHFVALYAITLIVGLWPS